MDAGTLSTLIEQIQTLLPSLMQSADTAHDVSHALRVFQNAKHIALQEHADLAVVLPAALLHDVVVYPKNHAKSSDSAIESAAKAQEVLRQLKYPEEYIPLIQEAIATHSFGSQQQPATQEAKIVQDADRLDALGAIGIARCFVVSGSLNRPIYRSEDPFCQARELDDKAYAIDHFYNKLLKLKELMHTNTAREMAEERTQFLRTFLEQLKNELT